MTTNFSLLAKRFVQNCAVIFRSRVSQPFDCSSSVIRVG